jgi:hypothetical protein
MGMLLRRHYQTPAVAKEPEKVATAEDKPKVKKNGKK